MEKLAFEGGVPGKRASVRSIFPEPGRRKVRGKRKVQGRRAVPRLQRGGKQEVSAGRLLPRVQDSCWEAEGCRGKATALGMKASRGQQAGAHCDSAEDGTEGSGRFGSSDAMRSQARGAGICPARIQNAKQSRSWGWGWFCYKGSNFTPTGCPGLAAPYRRWGRCS